SFAARQIPESRRLMRERRNNRAYVSPQLGCGNSAVAVRVGQPLKPLQKGPREYRMSAGSVIGNFLIGASGSEYLTRCAPGYLFEIVLAFRQNTAAPGKREPAVARVDDKVDVLGGNQFAKLLKLSHADGSRLRSFRICVDWYDVAQFLSARQTSRRAVPGKKHKHPVLLPDLSRIREFIPKRRYDCFACRLLVEQLDDVALLEPEPAHQRLFNRIRVVHAIPQLRPALVVVDPDHHGPALAVVAPRRLIHGRGSGSRPLTATSCRLLCRRGFVLLVANQQKRVVLLCKFIKYQW